RRRWRRWDDDAGVRTRLGSRAEARRDDWLHPLRRADDSLAWQLGRGRVACAQRIDLAFPLDRHPQSVAGGEHERRRDIWQLGLGGGIAPRGDGLPFDQMPREPTTRRLSYRVDDEMGAGHYQYKSLYHSPPAPSPPSSLSRLIAS